MNPTTTATGRSAGLRDAGSTALRAAGRQLLTTAGNQVLKAAVDRAVGTVDQAAGRLDAFAARPPRPSAGRVAGTPAGGADASGPEGGQGGRVRAAVGASFSFVVQRAMLLLQLVQRWVRQLLDALARLADRVRDRGAPDQEEKGEQEPDPEPTPSAGRHPEPAAAPRPARSPADGEAPRRRRKPAPDTPKTPVRRRPVSGRTARPASGG